MLWYGSCLASETPALGPPFGSGNEVGVPLCFILHFDHLPFCSIAIYYSADLILSLIRFVMGTLIQLTQGENLK
jgi:hypothetical protein